MGAQAVVALPVLQSHCRLFAVLDPAFAVVDALAAPERDLGPEPAERLDQRLAWVRSSPRLRAAVAFSQEVERSAV